MKMKKSLLKAEDVISLCEKALESCYDNYGSESYDNGEGCEQFYDEELVEKALKVIKEWRRLANGDKCSRLQK